MATTRAAILEPRSADRRRIQDGLVRAGLEVTAAEAPEALTREALVVLGPSITRVGPLLKAVRGKLPRAVVLAGRRSLQKVSGVDGVLPLPVSPLDLAVRLPELQRLRRRESVHEEAPKPAAPPEPSTQDPYTHFSTYDHFKDVLLVEIKRARRYGFPVTFAYLGFDDASVSSSQSLRAPLYGGLALSIRRSLRDTDFPVQYGSDRVLLVMPHTDAAGALVVSRRICERVGRASLLHEGEQLHPTISVGIAAVEPGQPDRTLGDVIRQAKTGFEAAQAWGGNRVELGEAIPAAAPLAG